MEQAFQNAILFLISVLFSFSKRKNIYFTIGFWDYYLAYQSVETARNIALKSIFRKKNSFRFYLFKFICTLHQLQPLTKQARRFEYLLLRLEQNRCQHWHRANVEYWVDI